MPCAGDTQRKWREGLMLSVDINTKSSTIYCLLPLSYEEQMNQPHGRDSRALKTERIHNVEALRCGSTVPSLSREACFQESGRRHCPSLLSGHSAQRLRADPLFHPSRPQGWLEPPLVLLSGTEMRGKSRIS